MNSEENNESSIERLKRTLYSRNEKLVPKEKRTPVSGRENSVPVDWGTEVSFGLSPEAMTTKNNSFFNKFLLYSFGFFLVSLSLATFIFFGGLNMISSNNLDIKITAPSSISSGEELLIGLSIVNGNRTDLKDAVLYVDYPEGSQSVGPLNKPISHETISLGTVSAGSSSEHTTRAMVSGQKDALKTFSFRIEYKVKGSDAVFSKEKTYDVLIGSSPVLINVSSPKEVNSGQTFTLTLEVTSNSALVMKNTLVKIEYPYGFTYKDSSIKPLRSNSVWNMGDLKNGDKKSLSVTGVLIGQDLEDRTFSISLGSQSSDIKKDFDTALAGSQITVGIRKSFFGLSMEIEKESVRMGQPVPIRVKWQNTLPDKIINTRIVASLSGNAFDRSSVEVDGGGFYKSVDNSILWDKNNVPDLSSVSPGDYGQVFFSVSSFGNLVESRSIKNPHIDIHTVITGTRSGLLTSEISSTQDITIKIPSTLNLTTKAFRAIGPFVNTGPIPPRSDKESTYTITWSLTNTANDLKDTIVSAKLPTGVAWKNQISPSGEKINFDSDTRIVSWNVGALSSGVGFGYSPREASFMVGLTPSISQIGQSLNLILDINASANDTYAELPISLSALGVSTQYSDPAYKNGDDIVVK